MHLSNDIVLRPRFKIELEQNNEAVLKEFEARKSTQDEFVISRIDDHVIIKIPIDKQHYWSPQLHLEIMEVDTLKCTLFGLFGPNPSIWTMFMFFHFIVAGLFIGFGIWTYSNWSLNTNYTIQLFITLLMVVIWIVLYLAGRMGKASGKPEMKIIFQFMKDTLQV